MKLKLKLKKKREEWVEWLMAGDPVNGKINFKFEGIIRHALEEFSNESMELCQKENNSAPMEEKQ